MKDIKQRIQKILQNHFGDETKATERLIEEIIKPIAKEAFEAGEENVEIYHDRGGIAILEIKEKGFENWAVCHLK
jgi:hypothetical protein